jgi:probable rRNA maturation factor
MINLIFVNESEISMPKKFVTQWTHQIETELQKRKILKKNKNPIDLTIVFLDPPRAKKLNFEFRKKSYATDVLSFQGLDKTTLGDLVICPQVIKKQSKEHQLSFQNELGYMILHGILHLLGYDHEKSKKEAQIMFKIQDSVFEKLLAQ